LAFTHRKARNHTENVPALLLGPSHCVIILPKVWLPAGHTARCGAEYPSPRPQAGQHFLNAKYGRAARRLRHVETTAGDGNATHNIRLVGDTLHTACNATTRNATHRMFHDRRGHVPTARRSDFGYWRCGAARTALQRIDADRLHFLRFTVGSRWVSRTVVWPGCAALT